MKKILFFVILSGLSAFFASAQKKDIVPFFSFSTFYSEEQGSYIETYLTIPVKTLYFKKQNEQEYVASVEATYLIKKGNDIVDFKKLILQSPAIKDTTQLNLMIIDLQRFALKNDTYDIELKLNDQNSPIGAVVINDNFSLDYKPSVISLSGIQLIEKYTKTQTENTLSKAGYDLVPLPINFYPQRLNSLVFYTEAYNTSILGENEAFLLKSYIQEFETKHIVADLQQIKREKARKQVVYMQEFNIEKLKSGNYMLVVEVRNRLNELLTSNQLFFQRSNPAADSLVVMANVPFENSFVSKFKKEELIDYISSLRPIATEQEKNFIDKKLFTLEVNSLQQFFYAFWTDRNQDNPESAWKTYETEVKKVQSYFATSIKKGFQTDRGRVYLQYGPPNTITTQENEPSSYPYEIWHYYSLNNQRNRKFVFWNRDLVTKDFELLHSDAIGEPQDLQWQVKLNQRNFTTNDPDLQKSDWGWGSKVDEYWKNPR